MKARPTAAANNIRLKKLRPFILWAPKRESARNLPRRCPQINPITIDQGSNAMQRMMRHSRITKIEIGAQHPLRHHT